MRRFVFCMLTGVGVIACAFALWWTPMREPFRSWRIKQRKPLVDGITMQIDDLYLYPEHHRLNGGPDRDVLRMRCHYFGGDPNKQYVMRGELLASPEGPVLDYGGGYGQFAAAPMGESGVPIMWEFWKSPPFDSRFTVRIIAVAKADLPSVRPTEHHVDFTLPCLPKLTLHGESYIP